MPTADTPRSNTTPAGHDHRHHESQALNRHTHLLAASAFLERVLAYLAAAEAGIGRGRRSIGLKAHHNSDLQKLEGKARYAC